MSDTTKTEAFKLMAAHEGGYVNNPKDPGGATMRGVTQAVYDRYRKAEGNDPQSVKLISDAEWSDIYTNQYWKPAGCDRLPRGLDYAVFDFAVNSGVDQALRTLQRSFGDVGVDGTFGNETCMSAQRHMKGAPQPTIEDYCAARIAFMKGLRTWKTFGKGWKRRVMGDKDGAQLVYKDGTPAAADDGVVDFAVRMAIEPDAKVTTAQIEAVTPIGAKVGENAGPAKPSDTAITRTVPGLAGIAATIAGSLPVLKGSVDTMSAQLAPHAAKIPHLADAINGLQIALIIGTAFFGLSWVKSHYAEKV